MNKKKIATENMWKKYLQSVGEDLNSTDKTYNSWYFGDEEIADTLAKLVVDGKKTGTTSLLCLYELEKESLPKVGDYSIILNYDNTPQCIIKIVKVEIIAFNKVGEEFARSEGEGDLTLKYWRDVHKKFFQMELLPFKKDFCEDMDVVCETFEVVYKALC